jgi:hypothetical protein
MPVDADLPLTARLSWAARFALEHLLPAGGSAARRVAEGRRRLERELAAAPGRPPARRAVEEGGPQPRPLPSEPFVFRGAAKGWRCCKEWTVESFGRRFGSDPARLLDLEGLRHGVTGNASRTVPLSELARRAAAGDDAAYLRFAPLAAAHPELAAELDLGWLAAARGQAERPEKYEFFIGAGGTRTPLHCGVSGDFFVQVAGRKRWLFYPPGALLFLSPPASRLPYYHSHGDPYGTGAGDPPLFARADRLETTLEPGDVLWNPPFWWHDVKNLSLNIGVRCPATSVARALASSPLLTALLAFARDPDIRAGLMEHPGALQEASGAR